MKFDLDTNRCEGYGFCEEALPALLHLDDDGVLHIEPGEIPEGLRESAREAVRVCPVAALRLSEDGRDGD